MHALSIRQPWAWAILHAGKCVENRTWATRYRGPLLIHAGAAPPTREAIADLEAILGHPAPRVYPLGGIVGRVELVDVVEDSESPWYCGPLGWVLRNPEPLPLRPCRGRLGLWEEPWQ